jgi:DNA-binding transcriptional ArsR family regulator
VSHSIRPKDRIRLNYSPFHELMSSLHVLVYPTPRYTFALPWVMKTRPTLPGGLRRRIDRYGRNGNLWAWTGILLRPGVDPTASVPQMCQTLRELPLDWFVRHFAGRHLQDEAAIGAWLGGGPAPDLNQFRLHEDEDRGLWDRFVADPAGEREQIIRLIEEYWQGYFQQELPLREPVILRRISEYARLLEETAEESVFLERICDRVRFDRLHNELVIHKQSVLQRFPWHQTEAIFIFPSTFTAPHLVSGGWSNRVLLALGIPFLTETSNEPPEAALKALSDPTRLGIYRRLLQGEATTQELAREFRLAEPTVSRHLQKLKAPGLVSSRKEVQYMYYLGNPTALDATLEHLRRYLLQSAGKGRD